MYRLRRVTGVVATACVVALTAGSAVAAGEVRTIVTFDPAAGEFPEGVVAAPNGAVYTGLSGTGRLVQIAPDGVAHDLSLVPLAEGDFGLTGMGMSSLGTVFGAVNSSDPALHGVLAFSTSTEGGSAAGEWSHLEGTEAIAMPNAIAFSDGEIATEVMFITDSITGSVWRTEWRGSEGWSPAQLWIADPLLEGTGDLPFPFPVGANGVAVHDNVVYVGVTEQGNIVGIPIEVDGTAGEPFVHLELPGISIDGIAITDDGDFLVADPPANTVWLIGDDGVPMVMANADDGISGPTSVFVDAGLERQPVYVANMAQAVIGDLATHPPSISVITLD